MKYMTIHFLLKKYKNECRVERRDRQFEGYKCSTLEGGNPCKNFKKSIFLQTATD